MLPSPTRAQCFAAFHAASQCIERAGIPHWIDFGTLLGAVREGGYISCDQDVDFNFFVEDLPRLLALRDEIATNCGLELTFESTVNTVRLLPRHSKLQLATDRDAYRSCIDAGIPYADLYPCRGDGKWLRHPVSEYDFRSIYCRRLERLLFEGRTFPSPQHPISLLNHRYGSEWTSPLGREQFDSQSKNLIRSFPNSLGCLIASPQPVSYARLSELVDHLRLDFDHLVFQLPPGVQAPTSVVNFQSSDCTVHTYWSLPETITPEFLSCFNCHFAMLIGEADPASHFASSLFEADVVMLE